MRPSFTKSRDLHTYTLRNVGCSSAWRAHRQRGGNMNHRFDVSPLAQSSSASVRQYLGSSLKSLKLVSCDSPERGRRLLAYL